MSGKNVAILEIETPAFDKFLAGTMPDEELRKEVWTLLCEAFGNLAGKEASNEG